MLHAGQKMHLQGFVKEGTSEAPLEHLQQEGPA